MHCDIPHFDAVFRLQTLRNYLVVAQHLPVVLLEGILEYVVFSFDWDTR